MHRITLLRIVVGRDHHRRRQRDAAGAQRAPVEGATRGVGGVRPAGAQAGIDVVESGTRRENALAGLRGGGRAGGRPVGGKRRVHGPWWWLGAYAEGGGNRP